MSNGSCWVAVAPLEGDRVQKTTETPSQAAAKTRRGVKKNETRLRNDTLNSERVSFNVGEFVLIELYRTH